MVQDWRDLDPKQLEERLKVVLAQQCAYLQTHPVPCLLCGAEGKLYVHTHLFCEEDEIRILGMEMGQVRAVAFTLCPHCRDPFPSDARLAHKTKESVDRGRVKVDIEQEFN